MGRGGGARVWGRGARQLAHRLPPARLPDLLPLARAGQEWMNGQSPSCPRYPRPPASAPAPLAPARAGQGTRRPPPPPIHPPHRTLAPRHAGLRTLAAVDGAAVAAAAGANAAWLEDCIVLLLCVLALDRFGDYGSDQVRGVIFYRGSNLYMDSGDYT